MTATATANPAPDSPPTRREPGISSVLQGISDRLVASDPGLNRLRMAVKALVAVSSTLLVELAFATVTGQATLTAMLIGAVVAMMGSMALNDPTTRGKAITAAFIPVAIAVGAAPGTAVAPHHTLTLVLFVVVMFAAVFVRRFGARFFIYGFLAWMGYFFSVLLGVGWAGVPELLEAVTIAAAWALLLSTTVLRDRPEATLNRMLQAFALRGRKVADAATGVLADPSGRHARRRLRRALARLTETALLVDGHLGSVQTGPQGQSLDSVRGGLIDAELALDTIAGGAQALADDPAALAEAGRRTLSELLAALAVGNLGTALRLADDLPHTDLHHRVAAVQAAVRRLRTIAEAWHAYEAPEGQAMTDPGDREPFEPAVTLAGGNLPGTAALAGTMLAERSSHRYNPLARLDLITRQAIQVAIAAALAIVAGSALDSQRYY
ncbi:MAG: carboxypeptidase regulatory-like domain-containing protein, partial [Sciscionella sp.]